jgi:hypothetical protein
MTVQRKLSRIYMIEWDGYESTIQGQSWRVAMLGGRLTQPRVIKCLSSVNCKTSSSSSMVQVSLVECCLGIRRVVTTYLLPLSFPSNKPHVSLFFAVFTLAIETKRCKHSFGNLTGFKSFRSESLDAPRTMRGAVDKGGGGGACEGA